MNKNEDALLQDPAEGEAPQVSLFPQRYISGESLKTIPTKKKTADIGGIDMTPVMSEEEKDEILLFGTHTCPNCRMAEKLLGDMDIAYTEIFAEDDPELARKYNVENAPTMIVGGQRYVGFGPIRKYLTDRKAG